MFVLAASHSLLLFVMTCRVKIIVHITITVDLNN